MGCMEWSSSTVKILLEKRANPDSKDNNGQTPLSWATSNRHDAIVEMLLERGADPNTKDNKDRTPLSWAT